MRKILNFFLLLIISSSLAIFLLTINLRVTLLNPVKVKAYLSASNAYELAAGRVRESLIKTAGSDVANSPLFEVISEGADAQVMQKIAEKTIDQFFLMVSNPSSNQTLTIPLSEINTNLSRVAKEQLNLDLDSNGVDTTAFFPEQDYVIPLGDTYILTLTSNANSILIGQGVVILCFFIFFFLGAAKNAAGRFAWSGATICFAGLFLFGLFGAGHYLLPQLIDRAIAVVNFSDPKVIHGLTNAINLVWADQKNYLLAEAAVAFFLGLIIWRFGRGLREEKIEIARGLPENAK